MGLSNSGDFRFGLGSFGIRAGMESEQTKGHTANSVSSQDPESQRCSGRA